jgi:hypothetical protein
MPESQVDVIASVKLVVTKLGPGQRHSWISWGDFADEAVAVWVDAAPLLVDENPIFPARGFDEVVLEVQNLRRMLGADAHYRLLFDVVNVSAPNSVSIIAYVIHKVRTTKIPWQ